MHNIPTPLGGSRDLLIWFREWLPAFASDTKTGSLSWKNGRNAKTRAMTMAITDYRISLEDGLCSCPSFRYGRRPCKHLVQVVAAVETLEAAGYETKKKSNNAHGARGTLNRKREIRQGSEWGLTLVRD